MAKKTTDSKPVRKKANRNHPDPVTPMTELAGTINRLTFAGVLNPPIPSYAAIPLATRMISYCEASLRRFEDFPPSTEKQRCIDLALKTVLDYLTTACNAPVGTNPIDIATLGFAAGVLAADRLGDAWDKKQDAATGRKVRTGASKGNATKSKKTVPRKDQAIAELKRLQAKHPNLRKTPLLRMMANESEGDRWGSYGALVKYCRDVPCTQFKKSKRPVID